MDTKASGNLKFLFIITIFGVCNVIGTNVLPLSLFIALCEYSVLLLLLFRGKFEKALIYYVAFLSVNIELDAFIYEGDVGVTRYNFFVLPILGNLPFYFTAYIIAIGVISRYKKPTNKTYKTFSSWLMWLTITGIISITIAMVLNDNNTMSYPKYWTIPVATTLSFLSLVALFYATYILCSQDRFRNFISLRMRYILISVGLVGIYSTVVGFSGFYGNEATMLAPLAIGFVPCLLIVGKNADHITKALSYSVAVLAVVCAFFMPTVIGSKWYIIIFMTFVVCYVYNLRVKSVGKFVVVLVSALVVLTLIAEPIISLFGDSSFNTWKITQALNLIDLFRYNSAAEWYANMDDSPLYRFDELVNIFEEFCDKPFYFLFGKGFGGTTLHHTNLLYWEGGNGTFSEDQIAMGAYYAMHESMAVLFLRHGILGLCFLFYYIFQLIKRLSYCEWALISLLWLFFYWQYGTSLRIGAVLFALTLTQPYLSSGKN